MGPCIEYRVSFTEEEREELLRILEGSLVETHAEKRRTEKPAYQEEVGQEESLIRTLVDKVRNCHCWPDNE